MHRTYTDAMGIEQSAVDGPKGTVLITKGKFDREYKVWFSTSLNTLHRDVDKARAIAVAEQHAGVA
ncbi:MAG: hypothetical protein PHQ28_00810 [Mycobacterium sp.]|nr:hypothetical protein [Mycobacterium sp.]